MIAMLTGTLVSLGQSDAIIQVGGGRVLLSGLQPVPGADGRQGGRGDGADRHPDP